MEEEWIMEAIDKGIIIDKKVIALSLGQNITFTEFFDVIFEGKECDNAKKGVVTEIKRQQTLKYDVCKQL